jgi:hypothetical protein
MGPVDVVIGLPISIKFGWGVWMAWGVALAVWYHRSHPAHQTHPTHLALPVAPKQLRSGPRPAAKKPSSGTVRVAAPYGSPDFITALDAEQQQGVAVEAEDHATV